jgi:alginate O-acetyltransferase complex protein AlgI
MLFNSIHFVLFFPIVTLIYFLLPYKIRWLHLLLSSCYFYMVFKPVYILILFFIILIDYFAAIYIEKSTSLKRKTFLTISILANISILCFFKYFNFFNSNLDLLLHSLGQKSPLPYLDWLLPIGLSFHTFQAMSYTIEVYRGNQKAEKHLGIYALYVMFYPQLVAGPIERPQNILPQLHQSFDFDYDRMTNGLKLMAWGMFKKVVIADRLAIAVTTVYNKPTNYTGMSLILATLLFAIQIYCDFSGYSDIAIGSARVMGFNLMKNFNRPYLSKSFSEFWTRWHISLSSWFKDYLYISFLGGNRVNKTRHFFNLLLTFLISGFWHGANWTFVIWGGLHAFFLIIENMFTKQLATYLLPTNNNFFIKLIKNTITISCISFAWIFFRAPTLNDALYITTHLFVDFTPSVRFSSFIAIGLPFYDVIIMLISVSFLGFFELLQERRYINVLMYEKPFYIRWLLYIGLTLFILFFGIFDSPQQFIYFQF